MKCHCHFILKKDPLHKEVAVFIMPLAILVVCWLVGEDGTVDAAASSSWSLDVDETASQSKRIEFSSETEIIIVWNNCQEIKSSN